MANKQNFTPEEWTKILESMMLAGMAVSAADPNGLWGTMREALAGRTAIAGAKSRSTSNELIKAVITELDTKEGRANIQKALETRIAGTTSGEIVQRSLENLREVAAILDAKAPGDAADFKAWLEGISRQVAEASPEGGFLGIGGVRVSDTEKATLADIEKALGTTA
jgi:hypothetical protein